MKISVPHFFSDVGVGFFWSLSPEELSSLETHLKKLGRQFHPDLLPLDASDEVRQETEAKSSAVNAAARILKNPVRRIDAILAWVEEHSAGAFKIKDKVQLPMELSMAYFEVQEALEDGSSDEARGTISSFEKDLKTSFQEHQDAFQKLLDENTSPLAISSPTEDTVDIDDNILNSFAEHRGLSKYMERILVDIQQFR